MTLLVFICNDPDKLEEVLEGYLEVGITGSTIIDSLGMGHLLATEVPIFAGFQALFSAASAYNKTILSVIKEPEKVVEALDMIEEICGKLGAPGVGIAFTIRLDDVRGLMPELE
jgi:nitrogen regulatory protein PII